MLHDVTAAIYQGEYKIALEFDDGSRGVVDFAGYLDRGGVFTRLKDIEFFRAFRVDPELGTLAWGVDWISPPRRSTLRLRVPHCRPGWKAKAGFEASEGQAQRASEGSRCRIAGSRSACRTYGFSRLL